jgi:thiol-disulfide isomerase/thioredoxin
MKSIKITLFHASWCGHCKDFFPEKWNQLKSIPDAQKNIDFVEYEESAIKNLDRKELLINGKEFEGYPTIKIEILGKQFNYMKKREVDDILDYIKTTLKKMIEGKGAIGNENNQIVSESESDNMLEQIKQDIEKSIKNATNKSAIMEGGGNKNNSRYAKRLDKKVLNMEKIKELSEIII